MITVENLSKSYGGAPAVSDVSFTCEPGTVTGFLGPNGAGKSTTLRMITGLTRPDAGSATVFGRPYASLGNPARAVGTLLDASAMHTGRTGRATLTLAADLIGVPRQRVPALLAEVGLDARAGAKRVGAYSLGMRQRLGIAQALLGDPALLILDEPANGLDPEGIAWMRELLRRFADRGGTVLLSSHLLAEVEATVDRLVVIAGGKVVADGTLADLLSTPGLIVRSLQPDRLAAALHAAGLAFSPGGDGTLVVDTSRGADAAAVARAALDHRVLVTELRAADRRGLERLFFELTGPDGPPGLPAQGQGGGWGGAPAASPTTGPTPSPATISEVSR